MAAGHAWQVGCAWQGGMCGMGCMHGREGVHAHLLPLPRQILRDTVNERAGRILLECSLVLNHFHI